MRSPYNHKPSCHVTRIQMKSARLIYELRWPNHCKKCGGRGYITYYENHGEPWGSEALIEACQCLEWGLCPRCSMKVDDSEQDNFWGFAEGGFEVEPPCPHCGFRFDNDDEHPTWELSPIDWCNCDVENMKPEHYRYLYVNMSSIVQEETEK